MYKKCKIIMLPTEQKSNIILFKNTNILGLRSEPWIKCEEDLEWTNGKYQNLYVISDEEIKEGDWVICGDYKNLYQEVGRVSHIGKPFNFKNTLQINDNPDLHVGRWNLDYCKKIIASTDSSLGVPFKEGELTLETYLPKLSKEFISLYIEEYNKGNQLTEVEVEWESELDAYYRNGYGGSQIKLNSNNEINIKTIKQSWNREEVEKLLIDLSAECLCEDGLIDEPAGVLKWIKENL